MVRFHPSAMEGWPSGLRRCRAKAEGESSAGSNPAPSEFGEMAERLKASVPKTEGSKGSGGSNPSLSAICSRSPMAGRLVVNQEGASSILAGSELLGGPDG